MFFKRPICHPVLPSVYDDSLSYYEVLCKLATVVDKLGETIDTINEKIDNKPTIVTYSSAGGFIGSGEGDSYEMSREFDVPQSDLAKAFSITLVDSDGNDFGCTLPCETVNVDFSTTEDVHYYVRYSNGKIVVSGYTEYSNPDYNIYVTVFY